jgi:DegV family protein with EDD domain
MSYKIIGDSCLDLSADLKKDPHFQMIPLTLQVGTTQVVDDETFDQLKFLELVKNSSECPKTACPSPDLFKEAFECDAEQVFVVTLSEHLSGTYNSAVLGKKLYEEEHGADHKKIAVFGSNSASAGQLNIALYIQSLCQASLPFEEIVEKTQAYIKKMKTYFVLESLDTLRKNGRLTGLQAFFATALNIKPVMGADSGVIIKLDQARGIMKALGKMVETAIREAGETKDKVLVIAHCNNSQRADYVKDEMMKRASFKDVIITETAGVATVYASDGGIVMAL